MKTLKENYTVKLRCATCGSEDHFQYNDDKSYIKCTMCNREYFGGIKELQDLNVAAFNEVKTQIKNDASAYIQDEIRKAFKGNKFITIK